MLEMCFGSTYKNWQNWRRQILTDLAVTEGRWAACQASNPPDTLVTYLKPARRSRLLAIMLRYPLLQCTAIAILWSISGGETLKLSSGHQSASSMCPASHSA